MAQRYNVISADSHLEISPERWTARVPAQHRGLAPRLVKLADGGDGIIVENRALYILGLAVTGKRYEEHSPVGICYDGSPGTGSAEQRLSEQDIDGVDGEVLYTSAGNSGFWRGIRDDAAYCAVIHAYNEFLAEEYCAVAPDRLLATGIIPNAGIDASVRELEYCAQAGLKSVALGAYPAGRPYPAPEDDRFWAASLDLHVPITVHVALGASQEGGGPGGPLVRFPASPSGWPARPTRPGCFPSGRSEPPTRCS